MEHEAVNTPSPLLGEHPRTKPDPKTEIKTAQYPWNCYVCDDPEPAGVIHAYLYNPHKTPIKRRDFMVHLDHWYDAEWEYFNDKKVNLQEFDRIIAADETKGFVWAMEQLREGRKVRRKPWEHGKHIFFDTRWGHQIAYTLTGNSKHVFTYMDRDTKSPDWELYEEGK